MADRAQVGFNFPGHRHVFPARMQETAQQLFIQAQRPPQSVQAIKRISQQDQADKRQTQPQRRKRANVTEGQQG